MHIDQAEPRRTPLYQKHTDHSARMAPFGGFLMPIQYDGILKEHEATRSTATLFDTCHMGELAVTGNGALNALEPLLSCDLAPMTDGQCRYGFLCNGNGGVIDDLLVYRFSEQKLMLVVNAGTQDGDYEWIRDRIDPHVNVENQSDATAKIDIQGPHSPRIVNALLDDTVDNVKFYRFITTSFRGHPIIISRTGYTGEIGYEFYGPNELAGEFWDACLEQGALPAGLGARDTLRLEMGMPLYGHELTTSRNAAETGFTRAISRSKDFIGSGVIRNPDCKQQSLVGLTLAGRRSARPGDPVTDAMGTTVGTVTSGSFSPSLQTAIALAYINDEAPTTSASFLINTARAQLSATITACPFYKGATARKPESDFLVDGTTR